MVLLHNSQVAKLVKRNYSLGDLAAVIRLLEDKHVFCFPALSNGLFPAAIVGSSTKYTGYSAVWVRDNVYVALSHYLNGEVAKTLQAVSAMMVYFQKYQFRFENIIKAGKPPRSVMERPNIRFDGESLEEIDQSWEHAQNDALGYFVWFYCKLIHDQVIAPKTQDIETLALFPLYFEAISYWVDKDSGHWEEERKVEASSIGVVVSALKALKQLLQTSSAIQEQCQYQDRSITLDFLNGLILKGENALKAILPSECVQPDRARHYDAALLFLIYPLQVLDDPTADVILSNVFRHLQGDYGVRRYLNDSFWCKDYEDIPERIRTSISRERETWMSQHNRALQPGEEAQWCIFDPILSAIFGERYRRTGRKEFLGQQTHYLNRSLGQITAEDFKLGGFKCPELYYLKGGDYIPNDATPLLWTQANLRIALKAMELSLNPG